MATIEEILAPIPGDNPSGENVRYNNALFDKLKDSRKQGSDWLTDGAPVTDYSFVIRTAEELLVKKSKDLQIAVWLAEAYVIKNGFPGLKNSLLIIKGFLENFWDTLYPEIEDGDTGLRLAPLDWFGGYIEIPVLQAPLTKGGHSSADFKQSQLVGYAPDPEKEYEDPDWGKKKEAYDEAIAEGKLSMEVFDSGYRKSSKQDLVDRLALIDEIIELIDSLNQLCEEKFAADEPPSFSKLRSAVMEARVSMNSIVQRRRKEDPDADEEETPAEETSEESSSEESAESDDSQTETVTVVKKSKRRSTAGLEPVDAEDVAARLSAVAAFIRSQDLSDPSSYLLLRGYRWGELRRSGSTYPDQALLEPPPTEIRQTVKRLYTVDYNYEELIRIGEEAMATPAGRGWIDLQRYIVLSCDYQGYTAVSAAIKSELKCLLVDMPDILTMTLMDDTPTANAETMAWIKEHILPPPPPEPEPAPAEPEPEPAYIPRYQPPPEESTSGEPAAPDAFELAQQAAANGDREQAVEILVREMSQERSGRAKFLRKIQLAQICLSISRQAVAMPILEEIAAEVEKRRLDEWENPDTVAHALALLYRCVEDGDRKQKLYGWICRLDPVQAMACLR